MHTTCSHFDHAKTTARIFKSVIDLVDHHLEPITFLRLHLREGYIFDALRKQETELKPYNK